MAFTHTFTGVVLCHILIVFILKLYKLAKLQYSIGYV
jgi:hypothetical protein